MKNLTFEYTVLDGVIPHVIPPSQKRIFQKFFVDTSFHPLKFYKISFGKYHKFIQII